ncbi:MAG: D-aminoacyl-tRNA deacylase [Sediminibacterium sp.]|nr:D-aminoacyl-tRNA deacylase [Sediminibacterium sp.]
MKIIVQRVLSASVVINSQEISKIGLGYLILLGITFDDSEQDIEYLCQKIAKLRIFNDLEQKMNLNILDVDGDVLVVSQFTLYADTLKGNRPSFIAAARPEQANILYEKFLNSLANVLHKNIFAGKFGADMKVALVNDGPVTIIIDSKQK